jgi:hypothetical protein
LLRPPLSKIREEHIGYHDQEFCLCSWVYYITVYSVGKCLVIVKIYGVDSNNQSVNP